MLMTSYQFEQDKWCNLLINSANELTGTPSGNLGVGGGFLIPVFLSDPSQTSSPMLR
jgi:hypothetical protein